MHLQLYVRGLFSQVELWKTLAQGLFWKWDRVNEDGETETTLVQGALRPSVLGTFEYIFPEECLTEVLAVFGMNNGVGAVDKVRLTTLRKLTGTKKVPNKLLKEAEKLPQSIVLTDSHRGLSHLVVPGVTNHLIGFKKDKRGKMFDPKPNKTYYQELL